MAPHSTGFPKTSTIRLVPNNVTASMPPAQSAVLSTPELLELVLLALAPRDLLLATRICRYWNHIIRTSVRIQRVLFFLPAPLPSDPDESEATTPRIEFNKRNLNKSATKNREAHPPLVLKGPMTLPRTLNPFFFSHPSDLDPLTTCSVPGSSQTVGHFWVHVRSLPSLVIPSSSTYPTRAASSSPSQQPSWKRMYLTQPPLQSLTLDGTVGGRGQEGLVESSADSGGLRMGDLENGLTEMVKRWEGSERALRGNEERASAMGGWTKRPS
ncbi:hypothetical protein H2203_000301 [Taxawa tesnikishii (nom. ined.)]|nr:hypothetical protein H2203_000301 [Dothideales sp. JES 119]